MKISRQWLIGVGLAIAWTSAAQANPRSTGVRPATPSVRPTPTPRPTPSPRVQPTPRVQTTAPRVHSHTPRQPTLYFRGNVNQPWTVYRAPLRPSDAQQLLRARGFETFTYPTTPRPNVNPTTYYRQSVNDPWTPFNPNPNNAGQLLRSLGIETFSR